MNLFIANCTKQNREFVYRLSGQKVIARSIPAGSQIKLGDLKKPEVDQIIKQHEIYGMVPAEVAHKRKKFTGTAFSIDTPIDVDKIANTIENNDQATTDRASEVRQATVVATQASLQDAAERLGVEVSDVEFSATEQKKQGDTSEQFSQTINTNAAARSGRRNGKGNRNN